MARYRALLVDWRGTLVHNPEPAWWVHRAFATIGRAVDPEVGMVAEAALVAAWDLPDIDHSAAVHRSETMRVFSQHGLDAELANALYRVDHEPAAHPLYPDAAGVLQSLRSRGVKTALVSDIHVDLRPEMRAAGLGDAFDAYILSFEQGVQKPHPRMFEAALGALGVEAAAALMVGDRASTDGGAAALGIATLILPAPPRGLEPRGLDVVCSLV